MIIKIADINSGSIQIIELENAIHNKSHYVLTIEGLEEHESLDIKYTDCDEIKLYTD